MAKKAKANNTTGTVRKRRRTARNRKRVERRLELSERRIVPRSELTPEEQKIVAMLENGPPPSWAGIVKDDSLNRPSPREGAAAVLDRAAVEQIYGRPAKRDRPVSTTDAATPVAPSPSAPTPPVQRINSKNWVVETLWRLNNKDKIPDKISKTKLAQTIVDLINAARTAGSAGWRLTAGNSR